MYGEYQRAYNFSGTIRYSDPSDDWCNVESKTPTMIRGGVVCFIAFWIFASLNFSSTTGEKFAKENTLTPFTGMWMATFVLLPMGLFLTYKAMRDSRLFNMDSYNRAARFAGKLFGKKTKE